MYALFGPQEFNNGGVRQGSVFRRRWYIDGVLARELKRIVVFFCPNSHRPHLSVLKFPCREYHVYFECIRVFSRGRRPIYAYMYVRIHACMRVHVRVHSLLCSFRLRNALIYILARGRAYESTEEATRKQIQRFAVTEEDSIRQRHLVDLSRGPSCTMSKSRQKTTNNGQMTEI